MPKPVPKWLQTEAKRQKLNPTLIVESVDTEQLKAYDLPTSFGTQKSDIVHTDNNTVQTDEHTTVKHINATVPSVNNVINHNSDSDESDEDIGPQKPNVNANSNPTDVHIKSEPIDTTTDNNDSDDMTDFIHSATTHYKLPITHESVLINNGHTKSVTAITTNTTGTLLHSGSIDGSIKQWNYNSMNKALQCTRAVTETDDMQLVSAMSINSANEYVLIVTASMQPKLYTLDCILHGTFNSGDVYIVDQKHTTGHTAICISGIFHPTIPTECITCGADGVVRVWDINNIQKNKYVLKCKGVNKGIRITACTYSPDGNTIVCATNDGNIHLFTAPINSNRTSTVIQNAHNKHTDTTALLFSDNTTFVSRGGEGDDTIKVWNVKQHKEPVATIHNLSNAYTQTNLAINSDCTVLITAIHDTTPCGKLVLIDCCTWTQIMTLNIESVPNTHNTLPLNTIQCTWNHTTNQIHCSCTDGTIRVLYSTEYSKHGILQCIHKQAKKRNLALYDIKPQIIAPNAIPDGQIGFKPMSKPKSVVETEILDKRGKKFGTNIDATLMQGILINRNKTHEEDTRARMLAHANEPLLYTKAYQQTQPTAILKEYAEPKSNEEQRKKLGRF